MTTQKTTEKRFNSINSILVSQLSLNQTLNLAKQNSRFLQLLDNNYENLLFRGKRANNFIKTVISEAADQKESKILIRYLNNRFPKKVVDTTNFLELCFQSQQKTPMEKGDFDLFVAEVLADIAKKKAEAEAKAKAEAKAEAEAKADKKVSK